MALTLVVSDLHIASGRSPDTGKHSPLDDFHSDQAFARFLAHYQNAEPGAHLVFNGDTFDPTQVVELPLVEELPSITGASQFSRDQIKYGLGHTAPEIAWKLSRIAKGHPEVFKALAEWIFSGHHIHFVVGNHDVELRHPAPRERLVQLIAQGHPDLTLAIVQSRVHFHDRYLLQPEQQLYVEHGAQYEPLGYMDGTETPACYYNNRYLFNLLEIRTPEADNIFPFSRYIGWLLSTDTLPTLFMLLRQLPDFLRARSKADDSLPLAAPPDPRLSADVEEFIHEVAIGQHQQIKRATSRSSTFTTMAIALNLISHLSPLATVMLALTGRPIMAILTLALWPLSHVTSNSIIHTHLHGSLLHESNFLQTVARRLAPTFSEHGIKTITFGHTHKADIARLPGDVNYFNTGTWVPIFSDDTRLDAWEQASLFVEVRDGSSRLLRWDDTTETTEPPTIIDRSGHMQRRPTRRLAARRR